MALRLSASIKAYPSEMMVTNGPATDRWGPWIIERAIREARGESTGYLRDSASTTCGTTLRRC
jgi:hypothetical protein